MSWNKWWPAYLWYSGILMQAFLVIMGLHALVAAADRRPAHTLHKRLFEKMNDLEFCNQALAEQPFDWKEPKEFKVDLNSSRARVESMKYINRGSVGRTAEGYHVYRLEFQDSVRDLETNELIQFPPQNERFVEVNAQNQIVACHPESNAHNLAMDHLQQMRDEPCEKPGWKRRQLCDVDTERCYPLTLCEKGS